MMEFENPAAFFLLLLIPLLHFLRYIKLFVPVSFPLTLGDWKGHHFVWKNRLRKFLSVLHTLICLVAFGCLVTAFAEPVVRQQERVYSSRGSDILFVVDTSPSMAARDMNGLTRLDAAKYAIRRLEDSSRGDTIGLVSMAKEAAVVIPPTMDRNIFFDRLDKIVPGELGDGTAIGTGLSCAVMHLENSHAPRRCIVLMTDGENNAGSLHPYTAAHLAAQKRIGLYVLGVGTRGKVPLEYVDPKTGRVHSGFLDSNYDAAALARVASEGDGKFFEVDSLDALSQALDSVSRNESVVQRYQIRNSDESYMAQFLLAAGILVVLAFCIRRLFLQEVL